jgi:hypothetical protein
MTTQNKSQMNFSEPNRDRCSYLPEIQKRLEEGASMQELQRLVCLELVSIAKESQQIGDALAPSRFHRRSKALVQHSKRLTAQARCVRMLGKYLKSSVPDRDTPDLEGKLIEIVNAIAEIAVDCLKGTVHNEQLIVDTWTRLFFHRLEEKQKDIFSTIDR